MFSQTVFVMLTHLHIHNHIFYPPHDNNKTPTQVHGSNKMKLGCMNSKGHFAPLYLCKQKHYEFPKMILVHNSKATTFTVNLT